jgi:hypothetical protein
MDTYAGADLAMRELMPESEHFPLIVAALA